MARRPLVMLFMVIGVHLGGHLKYKRTLEDISDSMKEAGVIRFYEDSGNEYLEDSSGFNVYLWRMVNQE